MARFFSVLAVMALALGGCAVDTKPYVWPTPAYGIPFTQSSFMLRYSDWWNTDEEVRDAIAQYCGPKYDIARLYPNRFSGSVIHPNTMGVQCGGSTDPVPRFRGQAVPESYMISLRPPSGSPAPAPAQ